jgi:tetratricopeptide (TPR) repeat protein
MPLQKVKHYTELLRQAREFEAAGELETAAENYEQVVKQHSLEEFAYTRLMIIYRKLKQPKKELKIINKGIDTFKAHHEEKLKAYSGNNAVGKLSKALLKSVSGKNTKNMDYPQPVPKWLRRKETIEKKL